MKRIHKLFLMFYFVLFITNILISEDVPKVIKSSSPNMPDWVLKKKKSPQYVYFVGIGSRVSDLKEAKKSAVDDAVSQLVEYIGFRATAKFKSTKEISDMDNISSFRHNIVQTLEGKGSAKVNIDIEDIYYEQYSDNTYTIYCLIKFPESWVEKERVRLQKLVEDQRTKASLYISEANESIKKGDVSRAIDLSINALLVSEKAAENSDLYDEAKNLIVLLLSSLNFSLESNPQFAYLEGGSDSIEVKALSSKTTLPLKGVMVEIFEKNSNAIITSKIGNTTDENGLAKYEVERVTGNSEVLNVFVSFSLNKFNAISKFDEEFYQQIQDIQKAQALWFNLNVINKSKASQMAVIVVDIIKEGNEKSKVSLSSKFEDALSGKMANIGYSIISTDVPESIFKEGMDERGIKDASFSYIKKNYPKAKKILIGVRHINVLGEIGKDIAFKEYDINDSQIIAVDTRLVLNLIDIATKKVEKGLNIEAKGLGLTVAQAIENAGKNALDKLKEKLQDF